MAREDCGQCEQLALFAEGALDEAAAEAFRRHLVECEACEGGLLVALQLDAMAEDRAEKRRQRRETIRAVAAVILLLFWVASQLGLLWVALMMGWAG